MRTPHVILTSLAVVLFGITWLGSNPVGAITRGDVCYQTFVDNVPDPLHVRLNVKRHSRLNSRAEEKELGHLRQTTYSAIGKVVFPLDVDQFELASLSGSVVVAGGAGARMALILTDQIPPSPVPGAVNFVECGSLEAGPTPEIWTCPGVRIVNGELGESVEDVELRRVDPLEQPLCSLFTPFNPSE